MSLINIKKTISIMALVALTGSQCHAALDANEDAVLAPDENPAIVAADPRTIHQRFRQAAMQGDTELVRQLLDGGADLKSADTDGMTALNFAVQYNYHNTNADTIEFLLSRGAGYQPKSLQILAARAANRKLKEDAQTAGETTVSQVRLNHANLSQTGVTLCFMEDIMQQANGNPLSALLAVIQYPSCDELKNSSPEVIEPIQQQSRDIVSRILIEYKDQLKTEACTKALEIAARHGDPLMVSLLLGTQACINDAVLGHSVYKGHTEIVTILLNDIKKRCLEAHYAIGETIEENALRAEVAIHINNFQIIQPEPLTCAVTQGHTEIVRILLAAGANIKKHTLSMAISNCHDDIASILLDAGADVFVIAQYEYANSPLLYAATRGDTKKVKQLLNILTANPENTNALVLQCHSTLDQAIKNGHIQIIFLLLQAVKKNPEINHIVENAFNYAFAHGTIETAHLFLDAAIERSSCRAWGLTSADSPISREHAAIVGQLCQNAGLDIAGDAGTRALLSATEEGKFKAICLLLDAGAQLARAIDQDGKNVLMHVVKRPAVLDTIASDDRIKLTQMLLRTGAVAPDYINMAAADGKTALKIALEYAIELKEFIQVLAVEKLKAKKELKSKSQFYMEKPELIEEHVLIQKKLITEQLLIIDELLRAGAIVDDETRADIEQLEPEFRQYIGS